MGIEKDFINHYNEFLHCLVFEKLFCEIFGALSYSKF